MLLDVKPMGWQWWMELALWGLFCLTIAWIEPLTKSIKDIKKIVANDRAGLYKDTDFVRKIRITYLITCIVYLAQIALIGAVFLSRVNRTGWIAISLLFVASTIVFWWAKVHRRRLLRQGLK